MSEAEIIKVVPGYKINESDFSQNYSKDFLMEMTRERKIWDLLVLELEKLHIGDTDLKEAVLLSCFGKYVKNRRPFSLNRIIHSPSSAGKDHCITSVLELFPKNTIDAWGRISPKALNYLHNKKKEPLWSWDGKILYLEEVSESVLNSEVMKVFTSGINKAAIVKDGEIQELEVEGKPVVLCSTATSIPNEEILNRFTILKADESNEQTEKTFLHERKQIDINVIKFIIRLDELEVLIEEKLKEKIAKVFPKDKVRRRRDFQCFLDHMRAVAILHQYSKEKKNGTIKATIEDYDLARKIYMNTYTGINKIPLKDIQNKIVELLEKKEHPISAKEISSVIKDYISLQKMYPHLKHLANIGVLESFELRDSFNNPTTKYQLSEEYLEKQPINMPKSESL